MPKNVLADPVLLRFRRALDDIYGGRIEGVVLFGSRARGDAHADSDYDLAVFIWDYADRWREQALAVVEKTERFVARLAQRIGYERRPECSHSTATPGIWQDTNVRMDICISLQIGPATIQRRCYWQARHSS